MTKTEETDDPNSTLNRSSPDEPLFILCARDLTAPDRVTDWAKEAAAEGVPAKKVEEAKELAAKMRSWGGRKKIPD